MHFTPTCASWITLVERWVAVLTESKLGTVCANWKSRIKQYLSINDETAKRATDPGRISPERNDRRASRGHNSTSHVAFPNAARGMRLVGRVRVVSPATSGSTSAVLPFLRCYYCLSEREVMDVL